jgi:hypothetical protein
VTVAEPVATIPKDVADAETVEVKPLPVQRKQLKP